MIAGNRYLTSFGFATVIAAGFAGAAHAQTAASVDRSATLRYLYPVPPAAYDPPFAKNQFQELAFTLPVYDTLVQLDYTGKINPGLATSWEVSDDKKTVTFKLRPGVKFSDGTDVDAAAVVKSLTRTKTHPESKLAGQLKSFESFEAKDPLTVVMRLNVADVNVLYTLTSNTGMIVSSKAIDGGVNLAEMPVGSGPYKLVSSGPQGANYERNDNYFNKEQNQFAKVSITPILDSNARVNAMLTGQGDVGLFLLDQAFPQIKQMVASGKFQMHSVIQPNNSPLWLNTKIKPLDNPKVRQALSLAIDRDLISQGLQFGECKPAAQPFPPGIVGYDETLVPRKDVARAKQLLQEAGVGPFTIDALVNVAEPYASIGTALKDQLQAIGVTLNVIPAPVAGIRPQFRAGNHGAMLQALSAPSPDPASLIDVVFLTPDNPGGVTPEFEKAVAEAKTKPLGSPEREAAYKAISKMAYDDPRQIYVCWSPAVLVARKEITGLDKTAYINAVTIPDVRSYGFVKAGN